MDLAKFEVDLRCILFMLDIVIELDRSGSV